MMGLEEHMNNDRQVVIRDGKVWDFANLDRPQLVKVVSLIAEISAALGYPPVYGGVDFDPHEAGWIDNLPGSGSRSSEFVTLSWADGAAISLDFDIEDSPQRWSLIGLRETFHLRN